MFKRHFLYLTNQTLLSVVWRGGRALHEHAFAAEDEAALGTFSARVEENRRLPTYLLTDLVEEDFRLDAIPHVGRFDRAALLGRKLAQVYRATPYRFGEVQDREAAGRRDDKVLFTAITKSESLTPWIEVLMTHNVPLVGIYSAPMLTGRLLKAAKVPTAKHTLVTTLHRGGGLRQTYFQNGFIKFSRMTPLGESRATDRLAGFVASEIRKTWQYLDGLRYFESGDVLQVQALAHAADAELFSPEQIDSDTVQVNRVDIADVARSIGLRHAFKDSDAAPLFFQVVVRQRATNHFAQRSETHFASLWRLRTAIYAVSVVIGLCGAVVGAVNVIDSRLSSRKIEAALSETARTEEESRLLLRRLPRTGVAPQEMAAVVDFYRKVVESVPNFNRFLVDVSRVLDAHPQAQLTRVDWLATLDPAKAPAYVAGGDASLNPIKSVRSPDRAQVTAAAQAVASNADGYHQIAALEGEILPFDQDYRAALNQIDTLRKGLEKMPRAQTAPLVLPLETSADVVLRGKAAPEMEKGRARFAIKITVPPPS
jgi:hypothetical protein